MGIKFYKRFKILSSSHPLITLTFANSGLAAVADIMGQTVSFMTASPGLSFLQSAEAVTLDLTRLTRFVAYQGAVAPFIFKWFSFLDRKVPVSLPILPPSQHNGRPFLKASETTRQGYHVSPTHVSKFQTLYKPVFKRVFIDQLFFAPISLAVFFASLTLMEGGKLKEIKEKLSETYWTALVSNWKLWPLVQFVNFCYVPLFFRLPFAGVVGIFWNTYLSYLNGEAKLFSNESLLTSQS